MNRKPYRWSKLRSLIERLRRLRKPRPEPEDPYAYRMATLKRGPKGRSGAAVAEVEDSGLQ